MAEPTEHARIPVVGIGASAGGLEPLQHLLTRLPSDLGVAFVVVLHLAPDHRSDLAEILQRDTSMPVRQVADEGQERLESDHVYVIPPDRRLQLVDGSVATSPFVEPRGRRAAIDVFFRSIAGSGHEIYAVILSGGGTDGAIGSRMVKEAGGIVLVQQPGEAGHASMPRATIATGVADVVLPVAELAERLTGLLRDRAQYGDLEGADGSEARQPRDDRGLEGVLEVLRSRTGHDFSGYKRNTVLRRLARRMQIQRQPSIEAYQTFLQRNVEEVQALLEDLLITVTTFFRDPDVWDTLAKTVVRPLVTRSEAAETIRCWVPGCATGEEAYSLAVLFAEECERQRVQRDVLIFASDVDERSIASAREGIYPSSIQADVSSARLERWFRAVDPHHVSVVSEIRDKIVFALHSIQRDPPFSHLDVVTCRNLLIYLDRPLQEQVMAILHYALRDQGFLVLGASERASSEHFRPLAKHHRIYQARSGNSRRLPAAIPTNLAPPPAALERVGTRRRAPDPTAKHRAALEEAAPPSVLVDDQQQILHLSESAGRFLQPRGGPASHAVEDVVRPELRQEVAVAVRRALRGGEPVRSRFVPVRFNGTPRQVAVLAQPRQAGDDGPKQVLLLFLDGGVATEVEPTSPAPESDRVRQILERLELAEANEARSSREHRETEEDLRAANEELQSLNEEYRSTTEELETSKEELQSINEELQTVNVELKSKLEEVSSAPDDLENLMAATDIGTLFLDRNLCIQLFTPPLVDVFNVQATDRGRSIGDITHGLDYDELQPDARRVLSDLVPRQRQVASRDGRAFVVRLRPYRTSDDRIEGVVVTLVEVTMLKRAEAVLRRSEERFRALIDASAQMVWSTDARGQRFEDSPSGRQYTGQTEEQWERYGWFDAVHPEDRDLAAEGWRSAVEETRPLALELRVYHAPQQEYRWTTVRAVPLRSADGRVRGWVGMNTDIHERKVSEEALREADRRKDVFLAMLGHELRNPLASVDLAVRLLRTDSANLPEVQPRLERGVRDLTRLVNDLLDISRISRDRLELETESIDLGEVAGSALESVAQSAALKGQDVQLSRPREVPMQGDPTRLRQVVANLLTNAIEFSPEGSTITVRVLADADQARVEVVDPGRGLDEDEVQSVFRPFTQLGMGRGSGLGIGLSLASRLVELHGGSLSASSPGRGRGSTFTVRLPRQPARVESSPPDPAPSPLEGVHVVVVDDERDVSDSLGMLLGSHGLRVTVLYSGEDLLERREELNPDVVLLDLGLPGLDGYAVAERLGLEAPGRLVRIALTGFGDRSTHEKAAAVGFDSCLVKPVGADALIEVIRERLAARSG